MPSALNAGYQSITLAPYNCDTALHLHNIVNYKCVISIVAIMKKAYTSPILHYTTLIPPNTTVSNNLVPNSLVFTITIISFKFTVQ